MRYSTEGFAHHHEIDSEQEFHHKGQKSQLGDYSEVVEGYSEPTGVCFSFLAEVPGS